MEINNRRVELMMVASFLIKNHGYKFITTQQTEDELWVANSSNMEFPIIRISTTTCDSIRFDSGRLIQIHQTLLRSMKREGRLLDLHINDETQVLSHADIEQSILNQGVIYGKNLAHYFPLIKNAIVKVRDPQVDYARITKDLEQYQSERKKQKVRIKKAKQQDFYVSYIIAGICILAYTLINFIWVEYGAQNVSIGLGAFYRPMIVISQQYWRFLTVGLIHIDLWHLFMNITSLLVMGPILERIFGKRKFLLLLFFSVLSGSLLVFLLEDSALVVGLSGGLYGCMAAYFMYAYSKGMFSSPMFKNTIMRMLMVNLLINLMPGVSVMGHLGGFLGGVLISFIIIEHKPWKQMRINALVATVALTGFLCFQAYQVDEAKIYTNDQIVIQFYNNIGLSGLAQDMVEQYTYYIDTGERR